MRRLPAVLGGRWSRSGAEGYTPILQTAQEWEHEYEAREWEWLNDLSELGRYSLVAGYVRRLVPGAAVLDVGCGEGVLLDHLGEGASEYTGIDVSAEAIRLARQRRARGAVFLVGDAMELDVEERFDVVVLNECLYYFADPLALLRRYEQALRPGGVFILAVGHVPAAVRAWELVAPHYRVVDESDVAHLSGRSSTVRVLVPGGQQPGRPEPGAVVDLRPEP